MATKTNVRPDIKQLMLDGTVIDEALKRGVRRALLDHKRNKNPIAVWRDGKVVWIAPEDIPVSDEDVKSPG